QYAEICGWALAHAHARSGQPLMISGYLGKGDTFDKAVADFSKAYADQSEQDHSVLKKAVRSGRLEVINEAAERTYRPQFGAHLFPWEGHAAGCKFQVTIAERPYGPKVL